MQKKSNALEAATSSASFSLEPVPKKHLSPTFNFILKCLLSLIDNDSLNK